jgi:1-acyl-sn-glycerol-3-phosphate acyltransferase
MRAAFTDLLSDANAGSPRRAGRAATKANSAVPPSSERVLGWFTLYARWYVARHFHAVRLHGGPPALPPAGTPLVVYLNHAAWWDPLLCLLLRAQFFAGRRSHAPMDEAMLRRYRFFARLGFFGVEQNTARGAARFLRTAEAILAAPASVLWLTPQGRFCDVRERPARFKPGLGHLAARLDHAVFLPLALEITHWEERTPEALARFGEPIVASPGNRLAPETWSARLEAALEAAQDRLAAGACRRDPAEFQTLLRGAAGVGGVYDLWRGALARLRGRAFNPEHGRR